MRLHKFLFGEIRLSSFFKRVTSDVVDQKDGKDLDDITVTFRVPKRRRLVYAQIQFE